MGRVKLKIKKLENQSSRQVTYSKRRAGIVKKAKELSVLCDIHIALLMFSPTDKPTLCLGHRSNVEEVIAKFAQLTPQERAKRKLEGLETLKKTFKKLDHDVNVQDFLGASTQTVEELSNQSRLLQSQLSELHKRLSYWTDPDNSNNIDHVRTMEESLKESLNQLRVHKEHIGKQQIMSLDCNDQFQNGMNLPLGMTGKQEPQHMSWLHSNDCQHMMLPEDPNLLPQRDIECPTGCSSYFSFVTPEEIKQEGLNGLTSNVGLRLQLGGQYPYQSFNLNSLNEKKFKTEAEMNVQESAEMNVQMSLQEPAVDYQVNDFGPPRPGYDTSHRSWASTSGPCVVAMFNEHSYPQQPTN